MPVRQEREFVAAGGGENSVMRHVKAGQQSGAGRAHPSSTRQAITLVRRDAAMPGAELPGAIEAF
jgi:hypothetical protein